MVRVESIAAAALIGNRLGDPVVRNVPVVTPPGYDESDRRYPTVYFLAGFSGGGVLALNQSLWTENVAQRAERLMATGAIAPMLFVIPDCITRYGGSQYINSDATGRYADHLLDDVVPFIDGKYRTLADRDHRAVMGKSSGGYGATVLAMRHPDVFGLAADHSGDKYFDFCYRADIPHVVAALGNYEQSPAVFLRDFPHPGTARGRGWFAVVNMLAMASCYSPNADAEIGFDLPFALDTGEVIDAVWQRWLDHDPVRLVEHHAAALHSLRAYYLDCGRWDEHHLQLGARIYCRRLRELDVPHVYEEFEGGHRDTAHRYERSLRLFSDTWTERPE